MVLIRIVGLLNLVFMAVNAAGFYVDLSPASLLGVVVNATGAAFCWPWEDK